LDHGAVVEEGVERAVIFCKFRHTGCVGAGAGDAVFKGMGVVDESEAIETMEDFHAGFEDLAAIEEAGEIEITIFLDSAVEFVGGVEGGEGVGGVAEGSEELG